MHLRPFQIQAIDLLKQKEIHLICTSPTGSGKGVILEKIAENPSEKILLITPLIALARQQARRFSEIGIPVRQELGEDYQSRSQNRVQKPRVWMISPERLSHSRAQEKIRVWAPTLIAIDECHCVWEWGSGFRPEYEKIPNWISTVKHPRTIWLSATLPKTAFKNLETIIGQKNLISVGRFQLPTLLKYRIEKIRMQERVSRLIQLLHKNPEHAGILFAQSRKLCESLKRVLTPYRKDVVIYHAGLSKEERLGIERNLTLGSKPLIIATSAFGLGMDFSQLDFVYSFQPTLNLLSLIQSMGRVGRTRPGEAVIFYHDEDERILRQTFRSEVERNPKELELLFQFLRSDVLERNRILQSYFH